MSEHVVKRINLLAKAYAGNYPDVEKCSTAEQLWAIEGAISGVMAANRELHRVITRLCKELNWSLEDYIKFVDKMGKNDE